MDEQLITYAHIDNPDGCRFTAFAKDPVPQWAVDIQLDDGLPKNWIGLSVHPTDEFVHWNNGNSEATMKKLRVAYDKIESAGLLSEFELLAEAIKDNERQNAAEDAAGEDI